MIGLERVYLKSLDMFIEKMYSDYCQYVRSLKDLPFIEKSDLAFAAKKSFNRLVFARNEYVRVLNEVKIYHPDAYLSR
jgi:hypothetical protein